jgi:hypothetical protein
LPATPEAAYRPWRRLLTAVSHLRARTAAVFDLLKPKGGSRRHEVFKKCASRALPVWQVIVHLREMTRFWLSVQSARDSLKRKTQVSGGVSCAVRFANQESFRIRSF